MIIVKLILRELCPKMDTTKKGCVIALSQMGDTGVIKIADNVVAVIASIAALETEGIAAMSGGIAEGLAKRVSGKQAQRGVSVEIDDDQARIDLRIVVKFGYKIDHVCRLAQQHVKEAVESMTGLHVEQVNIRVEGVDFEKGKNLEPGLEPILP